MARAETGSIQKLDKDRWRIRVSGGADPVTGKRIRLSKTIRGTKKDAIAERTRMQIEVGDVDRAAKDMTVAQYLEDVFLPYQEQNVRRQSYVAYKWRIKKHITPTLGHIPLGKLSPYTVEMWIKNLESTNLRHDMFKLLRRSYNLAYRWGLIHKNIFDKLEAPPREYEDKTVADAELAAMIIAAMYGEKIEPIFLLELSCGLRMSEALAIDWEDIDFRTGTVNISRSYHYVQGEGCRFADVKTKRSKRKVAIPKSVLERLLEIRTEGGTVRFGPLCYGFYRKNAHERVSPGAYRHQYERIYKSKLPNEQYITLRNLRHTHATILLTQGVDIKTIADRLGHTDPRTTMRCYLQHVEELDEGASSAFDDAIRVARPAPPPERNVVEFKQVKEA